MTFKNGVATPALVNAGTPRNTGTPRLSGSGVLRSSRTTLVARGQPRCDLGAVSGLVQQRLEDSAAPGWAAPGGRRPGSEGAQCQASDSAPTGRIWHGRAYKGAIPQC
jgi:hypothetical protein